MFRFERDRLRQRPEGALAIEVPIRFQDIDAAGIIFYPRALELCHDLYAVLLERAGLPLHEVLKGPWHAPVRHAEADYLKPLRFGDRVELAVVAARFEPAEAPTELTLGYRIAKVPSGEVAVLAQTVHTFVEAASFKRTAAPAQLRSLLAPLAE